VSILSWVRQKNENVCVKIYTNGQKFNVDKVGRQFDSIDDLILHYKEYPLKTAKGNDIHLDQVKCNYIATHNL